jgi:DNA-binding MarR family transcriptional regulator
LSKARYAKEIEPVEAVLRRPGHLLRRCHQIAVAIFLDECQGYDLTPPQYAVLTALATHGPLDKATIGGVTALDRTTVAVVVKNLIESGLLASRASGQDRRATRNQISPKGLARLRAMQDAAARAQERTLAPLAPRERKELVRLLSKLADANNLLSRAPHRAHLPTDV